MSSLPDIARRTASEHDMLPAGSPVVAMVSGGADSVSLLRLLASGELGQVALSVLHVDHMLRGEASDGDAAFIASTCAGLGVPCDIARFDVGEYADEHGLNLEDAGRRVRYRFAEERLDARCVAEGVDHARGRIAVAHTYDDRMETFLMRLATGSGSGGLSSIPYVRDRVVRPLLDARRFDVVAYLTGIAQEWREDATNADTSRQRARVRAQVLPLLEAMNPRFDEALSRTLTILADEDELLEDMAEAFARDFTEVVSGALRIERSRAVTLSRAMRRRMLRTAVFDAFPEASRLEFSHIEALVDGLDDDSFFRDLPGGLRAATEYGTLVVARGADGREGLAPSLLGIPGTTDLGEAGSLTAAEASPADIGDDPMEALVDADRICGPLSVGSAGPGERMRPLGMRGTRKLSDVLTDAKVPRVLRLVTPVVRDGGEVVWVAGVRMSEDYKVCPTTRRALRLTWSGPARR
jgi:tRNA(Ile)-lysidine synthase